MESPWRMWPPPIIEAWTWLFSPWVPPLRRNSREKVAAAGAIVIDNSSAWRMDPECPLVVPEVNASALDRIPKGHRGQPQLHDHGLHAGAGPIARRGRPPAAGGFDLPGRVRRRPGRHRRARRADPGGRGQGHRTHLRRRLAAVPAQQDLPSPVAFNVLPHAGSFDGDETTEEIKFRNESRKILDIADLAVSVTCVRVPVYTGHALALNLTFRGQHPARAGPGAAAAGPGGRGRGRPHPVALGWRGQLPGRSGPGRPQRSQWARTDDICGRRQPAQGRRPERGTDRGGAARPGCPGPIARHFPQRRHKSGSNDHRLTPDKLLTNPSISPE